MRRAGRMNIGTALLFLPVIVFAAGLLRLFVGDLPAAQLRGELVPGLPEGVGGVGPGDPIEGYGGSVALDEGELRVRLVPFHRSEPLRAVADRALRERLDVADGNPWRLDLDFDPAEADEGETVAPVSELGIDGAELAVFDDEGQALRVVLPDPEALERGEPLAALFQPARSVPAAGTSVLLFGRAPGSGASLRLASGGARPAVSLVATSYPAADVARSFVRVGEPLDGREDPREAEIARLRAALEAETLRRKERELEWYEFNRALTELGLDSVPTFPVDEELIQADEDAQGEAPDDVEVAALPDRSHDVHVGLRALMDLADMPSYDLLESGSLSRDGIGPVVFRLLDDRGRLAGSLMAERLRLEGSRSGRTITIVLEDGHERRGGERFPFHDGVRRISLPFIDPEPWMESLPELFPADALAAVRDDGLWDREQVRRELNRLLSADTSSGWYRLQGMGGVVGDDLVDVQLEAYDPDGRLDRRFFADKLRVFVESPGVLLRLEGGVIQRGQERTAFLDGVHRIFLPRARTEDWQDTRLPGL